MRVQQVAHCFVQGQVTTLAAAEGMIDAGLSTVALGASMDVADITGVAGTGHAIYGFLAIGAAIADAHTPGERAGAGLWIAAQTAKSAAYYVAGHYGGHAGACAATIGLASLVQIGVGLTADKDDCR